jgi:hypothetical protein
MLKRIQKMTARILKSTPAFGRRNCYWQTCLPSSPV